MAKDNNMMGGAFVIFGLFLAIGFMLAVQSMPFPLTAIEQSVAYLFALLLVISGLFLMLK